MLIRILEATDAQQYQQLRLNGLRTNPEAFGSTYERESRFSLETVMERMRPTKDKFVLGAFDVSSQLAGNVALVREGGMKTMHKANVFGMYVSKEKRGQGIGKQLMLELIRIANQIDGLEQINLSVISDNEPAKNLYKSVGFEIFGVEKRAFKYNGQYFDEDWMALRL